MRSAVIASILGLSLWAGSALADSPVSFRNDVLPILTKAGCNGGSCHAKQGGQNGFQLTIFAYHPKADYREIVYNARGRRVFPAAPDESLLLLKATQAVDHEGGRKIEPGSEHYKTLRNWIAQGMPYEVPNEPALIALDIQPAAARYAKNSKQQLKVTARYSDQSARDVTHLCEYSAPDEAMAEVDEHGVITAGRASGDGVVIVRYMEMVEVARVAIPPDQILPESAYAALPVKNEIDRLAYARHRELGLIVSDPCTDADFIRRASLDATGKLPTPERVRSFLDDTSKDKRERLVEELLADPDWADYWATKWRDLIGPNTQHAGVKPMFLLNQWIRLRLRENIPYDQFVRELLTAEGSTHEYGPVAIYRDQREPDRLSAYVSRLFLGVRMDCAKCHHHPSEKWGQEDYYQLAAFFGSMKRKGQGISAPISGEPEFWWFEPGGEVKHPVTEEVMKPKPPDGPFLELAADKDPRAALTDWMTQPENPFFAKAAVNRVWGEFFGRGLTHPVDDFRASNPCVNEPLLDWLAQDFIQHKYDLKHLMARLMNSHLYQVSSLPNDTNRTDTRNFSRSYRRRLQAEVMLDAISGITGIRDTFQGLPSDSRAMMTWNNKLNSTFLDTFGRPDSSADCPCERDRNPTVVQALHLMNSEDLQAKIEAPKSWLRTLAASDRTPEQVVEEIYLAAYARLPRPDEMKSALAGFKAEGADRNLAAEDVLWALINSAEFVFNH